MCELAVILKVVTPILGGANQTRKLDDIDVIRPASVRGHLRFWWRAVFAHNYSTPEELYKAESDLWGCAARDHGGRSGVLLFVDLLKIGEIDTQPIRYSDSREGKQTRGVYALWPAKEQKQDLIRNKAYVPTANRRQFGTFFKLTVKVPLKNKLDVRFSLNAWLLFGGYGSRVRRGLGSLSVVNEAETWLPKEKNSLYADLGNLFAGTVNFSPIRNTSDVPWLAGASLEVGDPVTDPMEAWEIAIGWLKEFRQGTNGARQPDPTGKNQRPSISNWPEADKIRHIEGKTRSHKPNHNKNPVWPRAAFGLPINGQFQKRNRRDGDPPYDEPDRFEIRWKAGNCEYDRLASSLIVKALPLADGKFVPCALWLNRGMPAGAEVGLLRSIQGNPKEKKVDPRTTARFDQLVAEGDTPRFAALADKQTLRDSFLDWLRAKHQTKKVAP
jgi:CRISPR-associated protein Cmr1